MFLLYQPIKNRTILLCCSYSIDQSEIVLGFYSVNQSEIVLGFYSVNQSDAALLTTFKIVVVKTLYTISYSFLRSQLDPVLIIVLR